MEKEAPMTDAKRAAASPRIPGLPRSGAGRMLIGTAILAVAIAGAAASAMRPVLPSAAADRREQCTADAGFVIEALAAHGIDLRTPKWRHDRARAIEACVNEFTDVRWLDHRVR